MSGNGCKLGAGKRMNPERWQLIEEIFHAAVELPEEERVAFLEKACGDNADLRREIERLLAGDLSAEGRMESIIGSAAADFSHTPVDQKTDRTFGPYRITQKLGSGGMGVVYHAIDTRLQRPVALKVLPEILSLDSGRLRRFQLEAQAASAINHPNIITIYEIEKIEDLYLIVSEYVEGRTLADRIESGPLPFGEILDLIIQVVDGLGEAHEAGIIHRDIKPRNIMITPRGIVKILDFGLAKILEKEVRSRVDSGLTESGMILGTVQYMSPEQASGKELDHTTDLYSLGVVLYEMITGRLPFPGDSLPEIMQNILQCRPEPIHLFRQSVPLELERIVMKCLERDPNRRYQTARELVHDLRNLKLSLDTGAKLPTSSRRSLLRGHWREIPWLRVAVSIALLMGLFAAYSIYKKRQEPIDSLAVLPFLNSASDPGAEYLSDGLSETIMYRLSQLSDLKVIAGASVSRYKGKEVQPESIARELHVRAILVGRVQQRSDSIVVNAELIDTKTNRLIWGEQYARKMSDLLVLQEEIAGSIAEMLRLKLSDENRKKLNKNYTENTEAYQDYLKGRYHWNSRTLEGLQRSIEYFQKAIQLDPTYALAYTGLADSYGALPYYSDVPAKEAFSKSKAAAEKAIEIDATLAEAHASLGGVANDSFDYKKAKEELEKALELNPNYAAARYWYADILAREGKLEVSVKEMHRALELDPLSPVVHLFAGNCYFFMHQYDTAIRHFNDALELNPNLAPAYLQLARCHVMKKQYADALEAIQKARETGSETPTRGTLGYLYAVSGRADQAENLILEMLEDSAYRKIPPGEFAIIYVGLGKLDQAFEWLNKAYEEGSQTWLTEIKVNPMFDPLRSDPRYRSLLRNMGLE